jgi:phosphate-selective porin OprO/OprP
VIHSQKYIQRIIREGLYVQDSLKMMQQQTFKKARVSLCDGFISGKEFSKVIIWLMVLVLFMLPYKMQAQGQDTSKTLPNGTDGLVFKKNEADSTFIKTKTDLQPNEFEGEYSTFRIGMGFIGDFTSYSQSKIFKQQMDSAKLDLGPTYKTRDFRMLASGRFLKSKRYLAWKFAYMYDGDKKVWMMRESGVTIGVPELFGHIFIGRTKEGFSMIKVMNGHSGLTNERQMALDPIPILADGIKWFGYLPKSRIFWNIGAYNDFISKGQSFSTFSSQYDARIGWMAINSTPTNTVLHAAFEFRYGKPLNGKITLKSRPESNPTPQLINTGEFASNSATAVGGEIYYRKGSFMIGSEVVTHNFYSNTKEDHHFSGGDVVISYLFNKTVRPYNTTGSIFGFVPVKRSVFKGGWGVWEAILHVSTFDLNDGYVQGGKFTRITPMVNWYLSKPLRLEFVYGYGILERYGLKGTVNFFETRLQITIM